MRKKYLITTGCIGLMVLWTFWLNQGCAGKIAPMPAIDPTSTPTLADNVVGDFENGKANVNPTLRNVLDPIYYVSTPPPAAGSGVVNATARGLGSWSVNTYGGGAIANTINGSSPDNCNVAGNPCFIQPIVASATYPTLTSNPSKEAIHIFGPLYITSGKYESHQLICHFRNSVTNPYFDATGFNGIQFDIYISSNDTNTVPVFQVGTDLTTPPSAGAGGVCVSSSCYNHYQFSLASVPKDVWTTVVLPWSMLVQSFGTTYPTMATHLTKILLLQFQSSNNSASASTNYTDYWVDNVQFF